MLKMHLTVSPASKSTARKTRSFKRLRTEAPIIKHHCSCTWMHKYKPQGALSVPACTVNGWTQRNSTKHLYFTYPHVCFLTGGLGKNPLCRETQLCPAHTNQLDLKFKHCWSSWRCAQHKNNKSQTAPSHKHFPN